MTSVKSKDNRLERRVRSALHRRGLRFRTHAKHLPGKPDISLPRYQVAVFVDGDFWHGFNFPRWKEGLSEFWANKIAKNRVRDARNFRRLRNLGWRVVRLWDHQLEKDFDASIGKILATIGRNLP